MHEVAVRVEHEEVRVTVDLRPSRQQRLVAVFIREVDLDPNVVARDQRAHVGVARDEAVEDVAPRAPFAADVDDHALAFGFRDRGGARDVGRGVAGRIELVEDAGRAGGGGEEEDRERQCDDLSHPHPTERAGSSSRSAT
jgi:hypothetical protein